MNEFWAVSGDNGGLAKACKYVARIHPRGSLLSEYSDIARDLVYLCEVAEFPGRGFQSVDIRYYGPNFKMPYQTSYEDITMTYLCRSESLEREFFDDWLTYINPNNTWDFNYRDDYNADIEIFQYSESDETAKYAYTIFDAYPMIVNPQTVSWADDQFLRLSVTFTYRNWKRRGRDPEFRSTEPNGQSFNLVNR